MLQCFIPARMSNKALIMLFFQLVLEQQPATKICKSVGTLQRGKKKKCWLAGEPPGAVRPICTSRPFAGRTSRRCSSERNPKSCSEDAHPLPHPPSHAALPTGAACEGWRCRLQLLFCSRGRAHGVQGSSPVPWSWHPRASADYFQAQRVLRESHHVSGK